MPIDAVAERTTAPVPAKDGAVPADKAQEATPKVEKPKEYQVREGGRNKDIDFDLQTREDVVKRLRDRVGIATKLRDEGRRLSTIDTMIVSHGEHALQNIEKGNMSLQDLSIARFAIYDELIQKSLATAKIIEGKQRDISPRLRKLPFLGRLFSQTEIEMQIAGRAQKFSTEYTDALHLDTLTPQAIDADLIDLNGTRMRIDRQLGVVDPLFDQDPPSTHPVGDRSKFHLAILDQLNGPEGVLKGKSFVDLWRENPSAATEALYEANQRALPEFAREMAKETLEKQMSTVDTSVIESQAKALEKGPTQKDVDATTNKAAEAQAAFSEAEAKYNELNNPVKDAEEALRQSQNAVDDLKSQYDLILADNAGGIKRLQDRIDYLTSRSPIPDPSLSAEQKIYQQASIDSNNRQITALEQEISKLNQEIRSSLIQRGNAERDLLRKTADRDDKLAKANTAGLTTFKTEYDSKKAAKETVDKDLKDKKAAAQGEATPENKEKAKALRAWIKVHTEYKNVIDSSLNQPHDSEFTRERIARTSIVKGQVEGAETIREQIFRQTNPIDYDPTLARKMLSDEAIARAIIRTYNILPTDLNIAGKKGKDLLRATLPYVRNSQFKLGDMLRFVIHEGLKSAEKGNPYLTLSSYFTETQAELKPVAETLSESEIGKAEIADNPSNPNEHILEWEGDVLDATIAGMNGNIPNSQLHILLTQNIQGPSISYDLSVKTNEGLMQSLPDDIDPASPLPPSIKNTFYANGHLRTDVISPGWLPLEVGTENDDVSAAGITTTRATDKLLNKIESISITTSTMIRRAITNFVLDQNPAERLRILKGISPNIQIPTDEGYFSINFDNNGNFTISSPEMSAPQELKALIRQLEQAGDKELLSAIQLTLGQEIIVAQQRR